MIPPGWHRADNKPTEDGFYWLAAKKEEKFELCDYTPVLVHTGDYAIYDMWIMELWSKGNNDIFWQKIEEPLNIFYAWTKNPPTGPCCGFVLIEDNKMIYPADFRVYRQNGRCFACNQAYLGHEDRLIIDIDSTWVGNKTYGGGYQITLEKYLEKHNNTLHWWSYQKEDIRKHVITNAPPTKEDSMLLKLQHFCKRLLLRGKNKKV